MDIAKNIFGTYSTEYNYLCKVFSFINGMVNEDNKDIFTTDSWFYIDKDLVIKNIINTFRICKIFKDREKIPQMCFTSNYNMMGSNGFLKLNKGQNVYFTTDVHGDLVCLLYSLLESGAVKYADGPNVVYFDMQSGKIIDNIDSYDSLITNLIPIPNLIINNEFTGKFIIGGDLIYRGVQSDSCFCLMYHLLNQDIAKDKIEYLIGNHEDMILNDEEWGCCNDTPNLGVRDNDNFKCFKKLLLDLISKDKIKFCYHINDVMFSHTIFEKRYIMKLLNDFEEKCFVDLREKIINKIPLKEDDLEIISFIVNEHFKFRCLEKDELYQNLVISDAMIECDMDTIDNMIKDITEFKLTNIEKMEYAEDLEENTYKDGIMFEVDENDRDVGLLWSREFKHDERIIGLKQVVGHTITMSCAPEFFDIGNSILRADVAQSIGTNRFASCPMLLSFHDEICNIKRSTICLNDILMLYEWIDSLEKEQLYKSIIADFDSSKYNQLNDFELF